MGIDATPKNNLLSDGLFITTVLQSTTCICLMPFLHELGKSSLYHFKYKSNDSKSAMEYNGLSIECATSHFIPEMLFGILRSVGQIGAIWID